MKDFRAEKIKGIKKEVEEFHPLLRVLFSRLDGVIDVEYKQGNNEMGADFVISKKDMTLGGEEYVGVVVKVGQITQSHGEVERQIEECEIERTFRGGAKKIVISEVWVVANGSITHNAQEKIHHKYKSKKVKFIDHNHLIRLIDSFYPEFWSDVPVEEGEYLRRVKEYAAEVAHTNGMGFSFSSGSYIPQVLEKVESGKSFYKLKKPKKKKE